MLLNVKMDSSVMLTPDNVNLVQKTVLSVTRPVLVKELALLTVLLVTNHYIYITTNVLNHAHQDIT